MLTILEDKPIIPRGRPPDSSDPEKQRLQIHVTLLVRSGALSFDQAARAFGISRVTVWRWSRKALGYDLPESQGLRRLLGED